MEDKGMTRAQLTAAILTSPASLSSLDDTVHDAASLMASAANNGGLDGQIDFLIDTCGWTAEQILTSIS